jgi:transposase
MDTTPAAIPPARDDKDDPTTWRVDDALWALLQPILRVDKPRKKPGRPRRDDRASCAGLIWLAPTGGRWSALPRRFGPKSTVHERFSEWVATGAPERAWAVLPRECDGEIGLDWTRQAADGCIVEAPSGKRGGPARRQPPAATPPTAANPGPGATT